MKNKEILIFSLKLLPALMEKLKYEVLSNCRMEERIYETT
jgi:hypothetical protein